MFATRRSVEFEYAFSAGCWRLVRAEVDWEVAKLLGPILFTYPRVIKPPFSPHQFWAELMKTLKQHKLDGGENSEEFGEDTYSFKIVVDDRHEKPGH